MFSKIDGDSEKALIGHFKWSMSVEVEKCLIFMSYSDWLLTAWDSSLWRLSVASSLGVCSINNLYSSSCFYTELSEIKKKNIKVHVRHFLFGTWTESEDVKTLFKVVNLNQSQRMEMFSK